jgi:hypothetical protein
MELDASAADGGEGQDASADGRVAEPDSAVPRGGSPAPQPDSGTPPDSGPKAPPVPPVDAAPIDPPTDSGVAPEPAAGPDAGDPPPIDAGPDADPPGPDAGTDSGVDPEPDAETGAGTDAGPPPAPEPTYLSATDRSSNVTIGADHLTAEWLGLGYYGVRSTRAISSGQGVFYFEVTPLGELDTFEVGVATAAASLEQGAGATVAGFAVDLEGEVFENNVMTGVHVPMGTLGLVVDYRGTHPVVHVIGDNGQLLHSEELEHITEPLFIHLSGRRRIAGPQIVLNAGNDTTNQPFQLDPYAVLNGHGLSDAANVLVRGWGATHAGVLNQPPVLTLGSVSATSIALGDSVTLNATASDAEDGNVSANISWEVLSTGYGEERVRGQGASFSFTPNAIGQHRVRISSKDSGGKSVEQLVTIIATGTLQQFSDVRLVREGDLTGHDIELSSDGRRTHWSANEKLGIRANQGLYHGFWYVEGHRLGGEANQAIGLVIGNVSLNPYEFNVAPPSCSVNTEEPGVYQNLIPVERYDGSEAQYYGLAVDYRGDYPIVYVIFDHAVRETLHLTDATVPIYPMLYGNSTGTASGTYDMQINFGDSPFHEKVVEALNGAGVDTSALRLCWGTSNSACP